MLYGVRWCRCSAAFAGAAVNATFADERPPCLPTFYYIYKNVWIVIGTSVVVIGVSEIFMPNASDWFGASFCFTSFDAMFIFFLTFLNVSTFIFRKIRPYSIYCSRKLYPLRKNLFLTIVFERTRVLLDTRVFLTKNYDGNNQTWIYINKSFLTVVL